MQGPRAVHTRCIQALSCTLFMYTICLHIHTIHTNTRNTQIRTHAGFTFMHTMCIYIHTIRTNTRNIQIRTHDVCDATHLFFRWQSSAHTLSDWPACIIHRRTRTTNAHALSHKWVAQLMHDDNTTSITSHVSGIQKIWGGFDDHATSVTSRVSGIQKTIH